ncbi:MBL fold metallo-hydrolase [Virgisporangium aliadipatigenens]|uniref:MBL fold metallo-hydrolase n=1 Tax=Virgisporangium aliadipatigenens TaxID=741659 RepID=UPI0019415B45|nr:MBL fold metallo-hydrolase [Virgisporangium aliadipatigenens]
MAKKRWLAVAAAVGAVAWFARDVPSALGRAPSGERAERVRRSPQYRDGKFQNTVPSVMMAPGTRQKVVRQMFFGEPHAKRSPSGEIPLVTPTSSETGLGVVWYGHSSALVEADGRRVLFDPVWSDRCSPSQRVGPKRMHAVPVELEDLPRLDAVVISHDHYDHLDMPTVKALLGLTRAPFVVPLGVGEHLERWGVPLDRIVELDWDEDVTINGVTLTCTAARHFSGRTLTRDGTLWASWVMAVGTRKVFYTGDSGYFPGYARVGREHGPFDATLIQVGAYGDAWPDIHMTPEEGVATHLDVGGRVMIPLHWGTFNLALHDWSEPVERVWAEAKARGVTLVVPRPGERVDVDEPPALDPWWQPIA